MVSCTAMINFCAQCGTPLTTRLIEGKPRPACVTCGNVVFADPKVAAALLVERAGTLLCVRRTLDPGRGLWCLPGGYVDYGEDPIHAAIRECREETQVHVDQVTLLDVAFNGRVIVITYHAVAPAQAEPRAADDADAVGWFAPDALPPLAFETTRRTIDLWHSRTTTP